MRDASRKLRLAALKLSSPPLPVPALALAPAATINRSPWRPLPHLWETLLKKQENLSAANVCSIN